MTFRQKKMGFVMLFLILSLYGCQGTSLKNDQAEAPAENLIQSEKNSMEESQQESEEEEQETEGLPQESEEEKQETENLPQESEEEKQEAEDAFFVDKGMRNGFMQEGEAQEEITEGYVGIYSVEDLQKLKENTKGKYILMSDIDMSGVLWETIDFWGVFDGNYHRISGLRSCLFKEFGGTVKNLGLENVDGTASALVNCMEKGTINNCYVTGVINGHGGLVCLIYPGRDASINIQNCYNAAEITGEKASTALVQSIYSTGGIVGEINLADSSDCIVSIILSNCENYGTINGDYGTTSGYYNAGGIVGMIERNAAWSGYYRESQAQCMLVRCYNYGEVSGMSSAGGILGCLTATNASKSVKNNYIISACANYNQVEGNECVGGICGEVDLNTNKGYNFVITMEIEDCLNTAAVNLNTKDNEVRLSGGVCGEIELNYGTCKINRCLNIGNTESEYYTRPNVNNSNPVYECNDYYTTRELSIDEMKNIKDNLPKFAYPNVWGISEWYGGFPHPYGEEERDAVMVYYDAQRKEEVDEALGGISEAELVLKQRYSDMLASISLGGYWPEDTERQNHCSYLTEWSDGADNYYALYDADKDGQEELLVKISNMGIIAGYSYDMGQNQVEKKDITVSEDMEKEIEWIALKSENYSLYSQTYVSYYLELLKKDMVSDIGTVYMEKDGDDAEVMEVLKSDYGIEFVSVEEGWLYEGNCEGKNVFKFYMEDGNSLNYHGEQVNGMTLLGLYPGMDAKEAEKVLGKYGFIKNDDNSQNYDGVSYYSYATGGGNENYQLSYAVENGNVTGISIWRGSAYAG